MRDTQFSGITGVDTGNEWIHCIVDDLFSESALKKACDRFVLGSGCANEWLFEKPQFGRDRKGLIPYQADQFCWQGNEFAVANNITFFGIRVRRRDLVRETKFC